LEGIKQVEELPVFGLLVELGEVLLKAMECETSLVVDGDLEGRFHEFLADSAHFGLQGGGEHHYLLLVRSHLEDGLDVLSHIKSLEHLVTLVQHEVLHVGGVEVLAAGEGEDAARGAYDDGGRRVFEFLNVLLDGLPSVHHLAGELSGVGKLHEAIVLFLDLEGKLASVTKHHD